VPTSNAVFFTVRPPTELERVGWEIRVLDTIDYATVIAVISEFSELTISTELNGPGAGSITMDADSPLWSTTLPNGQPAETLKDYPYLWQCWEDGSLRAEWIRARVDEAPVDEEETRTVTISGPGSADTLRWAKVLPPGFPAQTAPFWTFTTNVMNAWLTLLHAAWGRGTIGWIQPTFTATVDSAGAAWADSGSTSQWKPELGTDLLTLLGVVTGQDDEKPAALRAEWVMWPRWQLDVRTTIGVNRAQQVVFYEGGQLLDVERTRTSEDVANYVVVRDDLGKCSLAVSSASASRWKQREELQQKSNVKDPARRLAIAEVTLQQLRDERSSWTVTVPYAETGRRVWTDYDLGDWIGVSRPSRTGANTVDQYRVLAISARITGDGDPELQLTLQSVLDARQRQLNRRLTAIYNTVGNDTLADLPDVNIPALPDYTAPLVWNPNTEQFELGSFPAGTGGGGGFGTGIRMFIQPTDPGSEANIGDIWLYKDW